MNLNGIEMLLPGSAQGLGRKGQINAAGGEDAFAALLAGLLISGSLFAAGTEGFLPGLGLQVDASAVKGQAQAGTYAAARDSLLADGTSCLYPNVNVNEGAQPFTLPREVTGAGQEGKQGEVGEATTSALPWPESLNAGGPPTDALPADGPVAAVPTDPSQKQTGVSLPETKAGDVLAEAGDDLHQPAEVSAGAGTGPRPATASSGSDDTRAFLRGQPPPAAAAEVRVPVSENKEEKAPAVVWSQVQHGPGFSWAQAGSRPEAVSVEKAAPLFRQLLEQAAWRGTATRQEVTLELMPERLGRVHLTVLQQAGQVSARIEVENHLARDVLQAGLFELRQDLADQGIRVGDLNVLVGQNLAGGGLAYSGAEQQGHSGRQSSGGSAAFWSSGQEAEVVEAKGAMSGLDLLV